MDMFKSMIVLEQEYGKVPMGHDNTNQDKEI
jgi:hypothetical protein